MEKLDPVVRSFFQQKISSDYCGAQRSGATPRYPALHDICVLWEELDAAERAEEQDLRRHRNLSEALKADAVAVQF